MKPRQPILINHGIFAEHDYCCPVYCDEPAIFNCNTGIFEPSWKAQHLGFRMVRFKKWQIVILKFLGWIEI